MNENLLQRIAQNLDVLVALEIDRHLREFPELGAARSPRIEHVLKDAGLTGVQIGELLGKSRQAVSQNLKASF